MRALPKGSITVAEQDPNEAAFVQVVIEVSQREIEFVISIKVADTIDGKLYSPRRGQTIGRPKLPLPSPSRTETLPVWLCRYALTTAKSRLPSPLKSAATIAAGPKELTGSCTGG